VSRPLDVVAALTRVSRELQTPQTLEARLHTLVTVARDSTPAVDHAGVVVRERVGAERLVAASDDLVRKLLALEDGVDAAPGRAVLETDPIVRVESGTEESRWDEYLRQARPLGLTAQIGVRFEVDDQTVGALHLYSTSSDLLDDETLQMADLFAAHAGLALGHARRIENLDAALQSRTVIGLALGMVMQRLEIDQDTAFAYLTRISATTETKLRDVAAAMVEQHQERLLTRDGGPSDPVDA
jgi:GAF domain-containing protein